MPSRLPILCGLGSQEVPTIKYRLISRKSRVVPSSTTGAPLRKDLAVGVQNLRLILAKTMWEIMVFYHHVALLMKA